MDDGSPELGVGFTIDTANSFADLERLYDLLDHACAARGIRRARVL